MSEGFDREAEKEKLREQLEREEESRKATEHMSELLLKGATMTNRHCGNCGDPIFRYQGQAFCPTCERPVDGGSPEAASPPDAAEETDDAATSGATDDARLGASRDEREAADDAGGVDAAVDEGATSERAREPAGSGGEGARAADLGIDVVGPAGDGDASESPEPAGTNAPGASVRAAGSSRASPSATPGRTAAGSGDLREARESLVRTLTALAREAEGADDARRARDLLEAAREAAETIAAIDSAGR